MEEDKLGLQKVPMLDASAEDFKEQLNFALWSTDSSSDYRNDRGRPYNGQPHTTYGVRGKQIVEGLTIRDIKDCLIKAMIVSSPSKKYLDEDFFKCWDFTGCDETGFLPKPTQFLLDNQNETDYISTKVELGTWRPQDIYKLNWDEIDPMAIAQNLCCEIEKMMGIFPNINLDE